MKAYDVVVLTARKYLKAKKNDFYSEHIVLEDRLVTEALTELGMKAIRLSWDDPLFDWNSTRAALFRTTWDYFDRFDEFSAWFEKTASKTIFINSKEIIYWNRDKHYLLDLSDKGIPIPPSLFINKGSTTTLHRWVQQTDWKEFILKPTVSGAGRDTYRFSREETDRYAPIFAYLLKQKDLLLQEFQKNILHRGELSLIFFHNEYRHAVIKRGKPGDFRVQDDFGGTVHPYTPSAQEIRFAFKALAAAPFVPVYARVDIMRDNNNRLCIGELELMEPELWFRLYPGSADILANKIKQHLK